MLKLKSIAEVKIYKRMLKFKKGRTFQIISCMTACLLEGLVKYFWFDQKYQENSTLQNLSIKTTINPQNFKI